MITDAQISRCEQRLERAHCRSLDEADARFEECFEQAREELTSVADVAEHMAKYEPQEMFEILAAAFSGQSVKAKADAYMLKHADWLFKNGGE